MEINLIHPEESEVKYEIFHFPDGEVQIKFLEAIKCKELYSVKCRIRNAEELFILMQVADILKRHGILFDIEISYLMSMRMDRVMEFTRPFSLKIVVDILKNLGAFDINVLEPHSDRVLNLGDYISSINGLNYLYKIDIDLPDYLVILPDKGAKDRYYIYNGTLNCSKIRNSETGKLIGFSIDNPDLLESDHRPLLVIDDLCDGGGTFAGISNEIRKYTDRELNIFVTHMVNEKGVKTLSDNYDKVYFTNSYKDWDNLPDNVTMIKVC